MAICINCNAGGAIRSGDVFRCPACGYEWDVAHEQANAAYLQGQGRQPARSVQELNAQAEAAAKEAAEAAQAEAARKKKAAPKRKKKAGLTGQAEGEPAGSTAVAEGEPGEGETE